MKRITVSVLHFILLFIAVSCIEKIDFTSENEIEIPFIDGYLTDDFGYQSIRVAKLIPFSTYVSPPISGAEVYVSDSDGNEFLFNDTGNEYVSQLEFAAQENLEYILHVNIDGIEYTSTPQELIKGQQIENFTYSEDSVLATGFGGQTELLRGISLSVDMNNSEGKTKYYKFSVEYTYIFEAFRLQAEHPNKRCYVNPFVSAFFLHENNNSDYEYKLDFYPFGREFEYMINYQLNQVSMNEEAYNFWTEVQIQGEHTGSIFDTPPYTIKGNMSSDRIENKMRGYFGVYSIEQERIFLRQEDLSYVYDAAFNQLECYPPRPGWPPPYCANCLNWKAGEKVTNTKPNWWP